MRQNCVAKKRHTKTCQTFRIFFFDSLLFRGGGAGKGWRSRSPKGGGVLLFGNRGEEDFRGGGSTGAGRVSRGGGGLDIFFGAEMSTKKIKNHPTLKVFMRCILLGQKDTSINNSDPKPPPPPGTPSLTPSEIIYVFFYVCVFRSLLLALQLI